MSPFRTAPPRNPFDPPAPGAASVIPPEHGPRPVHPETFTVRVYELDNERAAKQGAFEPGVNPRLLGEHPLPWTSRLVAREQRGRELVERLYRRRPAINHASGSHDLVAIVHPEKRR